MKENKYDDNIFFQKIQSNESLAEKDWLVRENGRL